MKAIQLITAHLRRIRNSKKFGIPFQRRSTFTIPKTIHTAGFDFVVSFPPESGAATDFLTCFVEDEYGLRHAPAGTKTIVDIGANVGFFSMASRLWFPDAMIHAYEPNPRILKYTESNCTQANVHLFCEAVGSSAGYVNILDEGDSNQATTVRSESDQGVPLVPLSQVVERMGGRIDLAKIDCEGAEWDLFQDPAQWRNIRHVRMEYHLWERHTYQELVEVLGRLRYRVVRHVPAGQWGIVWCSSEVAA